MEAYSKPPSLWHLVEEIVPPHEHGEIREMLGYSLVEQSLELHHEITTLLEIWGEVRKERSDTASSPRFLPEPPNQRDHLIKEICFFVESVKEKAKQKGVNPELILKKHNSGVINYASEVAYPGSTMSPLSWSSDGRETPLISVSKVRYQASEVKEKLEAVNKQLNYLDFDKVCENLRSTLIKEINQLLEDAQFLQTCLDNEVDIRDCVTPGPLSREPTLAELREERSLLEKELLATGSLTATPFVNKPKFNLDNILPWTPPSSSDSSLSFTPNLSETSSPEEHSVGSPLYTSKSKPLKASHNISVSTTSPGKLTSAKLKVAMDTASKPNTLFNRTLFSPVKPSLPAQSSHSDSDLKPLKTNEQKLLLTDQNHTLKTVKHVVSDYRTNRRSASTGRLRVVDVTNIVDAATGKGDPVATAADCLRFSASPSSVSSSSFGPSSPVFTSDADTIIRPGSAHADRFRKMVLGCRDGE
ncbi:Coiled-coil domain-containing protein 24 [Bulinus truncatus]|nr:Coiled-coil domain-containing protein 24 [Bulinus truncatus]